VSDSYEAVDDIRRNLVVTCLLTAESKVVKNITTNSTEPEEEMEPDPSEEILKELQQLSCPDDCNGNGECQNGTCNCHPGT